MTCPECEARVMAQIAKTGGKPGGAALGLLISYEHDRHLLLLAIGALVPTLN